MHPSKLCRCPGVVGRQNWTRGQAHMSCAGGWYRRVEGSDGEISDGPVEHKQLKSRQQRPKKLGILSESSDPA